MKIRKIDTGWVTESRSPTYQLILTYFNHNSEFSRRDGPAITFVDQHGNESYEYWVDGKEFSYTDYNTMFLSPLGRLING